MVIKSAGNVLFIVLISVRVACSASTHVRAVVRHYRNAKITYNRAKITNNSAVQRASDLLILQPKALFENKLCGEEVLVNNLQ